MPRNKMSNNLDHVEKDPKPSKTLKGRPPRLWLLPKYKLAKIKQLWTNGESQLLDTNASDDRMQSSIYSSIMRPQMVKLSLHQLKQVIIVQNYHLFLEKRSHLW